MILAITVTYTKGDDSYTVTDRTISIQAALLEITKKSINGLLKPKYVKDAKMISFTLYASSEGKVFPFFFGSIK